MGAKRGPAIHISATVQTDHHLVKIAFADHPFGAGKQPEGEKDDPQEQNPHCPGQSRARSLPPFLGVLIDPKCQNDSDQKTEKSDQE
jgi:hypothetical protein